MFAQIYTLYIHFLAALAIYAYLPCFLIHVTDYFVVTVAYTCTCNYTILVLQESLPESTELSTKLSTSLKRISESFIIAPEVCLRSSTELLFDAL